MASPSEIASALLARCATLEVGSPALPIAYPDVPFTPPASGKYIRVDVFFNRPAWEGHQSKMDQGLMQVTVVWPKVRAEGDRLGVLPILEAVDDVIDHFPIALQLTNGVKIGHAYAASPLHEGSETRIPVTIPWVSS